MKRTFPRIYVFLAAAALLGALALVFSTHLGPGVGGDATIYMTSARNLVKGTGLGLVSASGEFRLLPYFPPFFPLVLAVFAWVGVDLVLAAQWLNIFLFALTIALSGLLVYHATENEIFSLAASALALVSPVLIPAFSWAMSEPLAIFLALAGTALLFAFFRGHQRLLLLLLGALLLGLSVLTRYSMAAFLAAGAVGVFLLLPGRRYGRLIKTVLYSIVGLLPVTTWMAYDLSHTAALSSRSVESGAGMAARLAGLWPALREVFLFWLVPESWIASPPYPLAANQVLMALMALGLAGWIAWVVGKGLRQKAFQKDRRYQLALLLVLMTFAYLALVGFVYITTYPPITIGTRMFSPMHLMVMILVVLLAEITAGTAQQKRRMAPVFLAGLAILGIWWGWRSLRILQQNYHEGMGFNSRAWQQSETIQEVRKLPAFVPLVTNEEMAVYYLTGRSAYPLAEIYYDAPEKVFDRYGDGILDEDEAQQIFRQNGAALVLFNSIASQLEPLYGNQTAERVEQLVQGLRIAFNGADGAVYYYP